MTFLKSVWSDLLEKRLWPVAVVLLVALVGVPVALGGSGEPAGPLPLTGATGATGAGGAQTAQVGLDTAVPVRRDRAGKVRDPFEQRKVRKVAASTSTVTATAASTDVTGGAGGAGGTGTASTGDPAPGGGGGGGAGGTGTTGPGGSPGGPDGQTTQPEPQDSYVIGIRFGRTNATRARRTVERLTPLPSADNPFFVYLGVLSDEKTAVFLLSSDVKATGDGACKPRASSCETIELQRGDTEFFDVTSEDGKVTQYQLDVLSVTKETADTPSRAVAARTDSGDKEAADEELGSERYAYDEKTGLLRRVKPAASTRSAEAGDEDEAGWGEPAPATDAPSPDGAAARTDAPQP